MLRLVDPQNEVPPWQQIEGVLLANVDFYVKTVKRYIANPDRIPSNGDRAVSSFAVQLQVYTSFIHCKRLIK